MAIANEANWLAIWRLFATVPWPGAQVHDAEDSVWFLTGLPDPMVNSILRAELPPDHREEHIASLLAPFQTRQVPMVWYVWPSPSSPSIEQALQAHGLQSGHRMPAMAADLATLPAAAPPPRGVTIEQITDPRAMAPFVDAFVAGFELPELTHPYFLQLFSSTLGLAADAPMRHYLARLNGVPVATTTLFPAAGVAGIYCVATIPDARGRGIGSAVTLKALHDARAEGHRVGVLQASPMGHPIYEAMGFRDCCTVGEFLWTPETAASPA
jgi:GNAT superfamily N-acetyltransferase